MPVSEFKFDEVLRQQSTQGDVYAAAVEPVVADVLNGYNGTVMAYGQTGTPYSPPGSQFVVMHRDGPRASS